MLVLYKRGETFHADLGVHAVRRSLGTRNEDVARRLIHRLEIALSEGPGSTVWAELKPALPPETFSCFAKLIGYQERYGLSWKEFRDLFESHKKQQLKLGEVSNATFENYQRTLNLFELFLADRKIKMLRDIDKTTLAGFRSWRMDQTKRLNCTGAASSYLDLCHLHHVFEFACKNELVEKNPVSVPAKRYDPSAGAQPFSADEIVQLEEHAHQEFGTLFPTENIQIPFLALRWTGFRASDAIAFPWEEVSFHWKVIEHVCHKNHKKVTLPISKPFLAGLEAERQRRNPRPGEPVLLHPGTGKPFTNHSLWVYVGELGRRAGVSHAHPHRFRDTFAVDMLLRFNDPYYVANLLGDTMQVVVKYYLPFVRELREKASRILDNSVGLEEFVTPAAKPLEAKPAAKPDVVKAPKPIPNRHEQTKQLMGARRYSA